MLYVPPKKCWLCTQPAFRCSTKSLEPEPPILVTVACFKKGTGKAFWSRPWGEATRTKCLVLTGATAVPTCGKARGG